MDFFDFFNPQKPIFLKIRTIGRVLPMIRTHLYRRIFWRGIQKWPYFLHFVGKNVPKVEKTWKMAFFEGVFYKNRHFTPLAVHFFKKIRSFLKSSSKKYVDIGGSKSSKIWILTSLFWWPKIDAIVDILDASILGFWHTSPSRFLS